MVWIPTLLGWIFLLSTFAALLLLWWFQGEAFLSKTVRSPSEVLVVEGWIGYEGIRAAGDEFKQGDYRYMVTTSGAATNRWDTTRYSYAMVAAEKLHELGIPEDKIIIANPADAEGHRTFHSAVAVWQALQARDIHPASLNVFTFGPHARRSRLVFAKVFEPKTRVGVISWVPPGYTVSGWWHSSERSGEMLRETVGYLFEALLNSGRRSNSPAIEAH